MPDSSSHGPANRWRIRPDKVEGLWARRLADGTIVYESKIKRAGKQTSETFKRGTTEAQAVAAHRKNQVAADEGQLPVIGNVRLDAVAKEALSDLAAKAKAGLRSERTHRLYVDRWEKYLQPSPLGRMVVSKIHSRDVLRLVAKLREQGQAEWTAHGVITVLRFVLRHARHAGYMTHDPFSTIPADSLPRQQASESFVKRVLRPVEIERLLKAVTDTYRTAVTFVAFAGLRSSEALGLTWADVDLVDNVVTVRAQLSWTKRGEAPRRTSRLKSRASYRVVPLLPRAAEALMEQLEREQRFGRGGPDDFVFCAAVSGKPIGRRRFYGAIASAGRRAGLGEKIGPQVLRRSVATMTAHAGLPAVVGAALTGHSRETYDKHYVRPFSDAAERDQVREALAKVGFGGAR